jgi:hypothetical protein
LPESKWTDECTQHLDSLLSRLAEEADQLSPDQRQTLASISTATKPAKP